MAVPKEVQDAVDLQYQTQQAELQRALDNLKAQAAQQMAQQQQYGTLGDQRIQGAYNDLNSRLEDVNSRTNALYNQGSDFINNAYQKAGQQGSDALQNALASLQGGANKLGLGAAVTDPVGKLQTYLAQFQANNSGNRANALANQKMLGSNMGAISLQGIGDAAREGATRRTDLVNSVRADIAKIQQGEQVDEKELVAKIQDLVNEKALATRVATTNYLAGQSSGGGGGSGGGGSRGGGSSATKKPVAYSGGLGLERWYKEGGSGGNGVSPGMRTVINKFIADSQRHTKNQYSYAMQSLQNSKVYKDADPRQQAAMRKGIDIYYKRYKG